MDLQTLTVISFFFTLWPRQ